MHNEKQLVTGISMYFGSIILLVVISLADEVDILKIGYLISVVICFIKFLIVVNKEK